MDPAVKAMLSAKSRSGNLFSSFRSVVLLCVSMEFTIMKLTASRNSNFKKMELCQREPCFHLRIAVVTYELLQVFSRFQVFCRPYVLTLLVLTLLPHWCKISRLYLVPAPNYWTCTKTTPQKRWFIWSKLYKIEVVITSLIEILNSGHMTRFTI